MSGHWSSVPHRSIHYKCTQALTCKKSDHLNLCQVFEAGAAAPSNYAMDHTVFHHHSSRLMVIGRGGCLAD